MTTKHYMYMHVAMDTLSDCAQPSCIRGDG